MTFDEEQEILERDFILTIENDSKWYSDTREAVQHEQYEAFANICYAYADLILRRTGMSTTSSTSRRSDTCMLNVKTRIALQLWEREGVPDFLVMDKETLSSHRALVREISRLESKRTTRVTQPQPEQTESETIMNTTTPAFQTKHYIFGQDVSAMSTSQLIDSIKRVEKEIADLKAVATTSTKIGAMVEDLTSMLAKIVEVLDAQK